MSKSNLWCDKYRPITIEEIYSNKEAIKIINNWIIDFKNKKDGTKPALFISGPPGIGKTTIAHLILKKNDFEVIEYNASDVRSQKAVKENLSKSINSLNISIMQTNKINYIGIIMDEVDGMSSGDRGGVSELVSLINPNKGKKKNNKKEYDYLNPIICISNNNTEKKLADLRKICLEVNFNKPSKEDIYLFLKRIINSENIKIDDTNLKSLVKFSQNDFRRSTYLLQDYHNNYDKCTNNYDKCTGNCNNNDQLLIKKDIDFTVFDAATQILNDYKGIKYILSLYESDRSLVSMIIHENYIKKIISNKDKLSLIHNLSYYMSIGDVIDKYIYNNQYWNLQDLNGIIKCVIPSYMINKKKNKSNISLSFTSILSKSAVQFSNCKSIITIKNKFNIDKAYLPFLNHIISKNINHIYSSNNDNNLFKFSQVLNYYSLNIGDIEKFLKFSKITDPDLDYKKIFTNKNKNKLLSEYKIVNE